MLTKEITVRNKQGLHARPASMLVQEAMKYASNIKLRKDDVEANAKSVLEITILAAACNSKITVLADGPDEELAITTIAQMFEEKFNIE